MALEKNFRQNPDVGFHRDIFSVYLPFVITSFVRAVY